LQLNGSKANYISQGSVATRLGCDGCKLTSRVLLKEL